MGGVLLPLYPDRCIKAYREIAGFTDIADYIDPCHQKGFFVDNEAGLMSLDEFISGCIAHSAPGTTRDTIIRCHEQFFGTPDPDNVALVKELALKYDVYLLSNNNALSMTLHRPNFEQAGLPLDTSFKKMFLSHELHLLKPAPEIYRIAIAESGCKPEECLFVDDSQKNVDGALAVGMRAVLLPAGASLRQVVEAQL